jgi:uncharacterized NAD(P)/FAD-binding protein YdhS
MNDIISKSGRRPRVVIIGGGFSGSVLACRLVEQAADPLDIVLLEQRNQVGKGVAYSTTSSNHLLNVRAAGMSAYPDRPLHFAEFAASRDPAWTADSFVPRPIYREYIQQNLAEAITNAEPKRIRLSLIQAEAKSITRLGADGQLQVTIADKSTFDADAVVLAVGNLPASARGTFEHCNSARYIHDPWAPQKFADVHVDDNVVLIGTGLTAVDQVIELLDRGHRGRIHAVSRHGLLPGVHTERPTAAPDAVRSLTSGRTPAGTDSARGALRFVRELIGQFSCWQDAIDSLRPFTQAWWQALPETEKSRFRRHLKTLWDVHRHRMAPEIARRIQEAIERGQLVVHAGRLIELLNADISVGVRERHSQRLIALNVQWIVNCTGISSRLKNLDSALIADLLAGGLARADGSEMGLAMDSAGRLIDRSGHPQKQLLAVGPLRQSQLLESVAVPELRVQVEQSAQLVLEELKKHRVQVKNAD